MSRNVRYMSLNSRSFLRLKEFSEGLNIDNKLFERNLSKKEMRNWMSMNDCNEIEVFYAENLNQKTDRELRELKKEIVLFIKERLIEDNYNVSQFLGIIELHATSQQKRDKNRYDPTSVNGHIHYWGNNSNHIVQYINEFIQINRLTNKQMDDYSIGYMTAGVKYEKIIDEEKSFRDIEGNIYRTIDLDKETEEILEEELENIYLNEKISKLLEKVDENIRLFNEFNLFMNKLEKKRKIKKEENFNIQKVKEKISKTKKEKLITNTSKMPEVERKSRNNIDLKKELNIINEIEKYLKE